MEQTLQRVKVDALSALPKEIGKTIRIGSHHIAIFRLVNDTVRAIENKCPHRGGVLAEGMVSGEHVFCPMHDWKICMNDGKVQEPDTGCVNTYKVEIENGDVFILI